MGLRELLNVAYVARVEYLDAEAKVAEDRELEAPPAGVAGRAPASGGEGPRSVGTEKLMAVFGMGRRG